MKHMLEGAVGFVVHTARVEEAGIVDEYIDRHPESQHPLAKGNGLLFDGKIKSICSDLNIRIIAHELSYRTIQMGLIAGTDIKIMPFVSELFGQRSAKAFGGTCNDNIHNMKLGIGRQNLAPGVVIFAG